MTRLWIFALLMSGCAHVAPYERAALMTPQMQVSDGVLVDGMDAHLFQTRESMLGATVSGGASCGCN